MDNFEYFKHLNQKDLNELKKREPYSQKTEKIEDFFTMFLNPTFKSRVNINIEQRIKHLEEVEKEGFNPQERNRTAKNIDNDVEDWFAMINNQFIDSKHKSIEQVERFFNEIDALIQIEEYIISLYIKEMQIAYINNLNCYRKRILLFLSEKSKVYNTLDGKFYITDVDRTKLLEKFNNYLDDVREVENTYIPPKFDTNLYESLENKINISKKIILTIVLSVLIAFGIWAYTYDKLLFGLLIAIIFAIVVVKLRGLSRMNQRKLWNLKNTKKLENQIFNDIENKVEKNIKR